MSVYEFCSHVPVDHLASPAVDTWRMGIQEDPAGMVAGSDGEIGIIFNPDRLEEGKAFLCECIAVGEVLVAVKLCDINEIAGEKGEGQAGFCIDEDTEPEDAVPERGEEPSG